MGERTRDRGAGRDVAGLIGDTAMSSLEGLLVRLRRPEAPVAPTAPAMPRESEAHAGIGGPADAPSPRAGAAVDVVATVVAEVTSAVIKRIDLDAVVDRVDIQRILDRVDIEGIVRRIDLDDLAGRLDVDAILSRVDVDALVRRIDLTTVTRDVVDAVDFGAVIRESTSSVGSDLVDALRFQSMRGDDLVARVVDRLLRRKGGRRTALDAPGGAG